MWALALAAVADAAPPSFDASYWDSLYTGNPMKIPAEKWVAEGVEGAMLLSMFFSLQFRKDFSIF